MKIRLIRFIRTSQINKEEKRISIFLCENDAEIINNKIKGVHLNSITENGVNSKNTIVAR